MGQLPDLPGFYSIVENVRKSYISDMDRAVAIANEFLRRAGSRGLTQMQIQKLVYFAHGWCLALNGQPLTVEEPEAWVYGPVYRDLYDHTKFFGSGQINRQITPDDDDAFRFFGGRRDRGPYRANLTPDEEEVIDAVWDRYGGLSGARLSALTHQTGTPWHGTYGTGEGKNRPIPNEQIEQHYRDIADRVRQAL